MASLSYKTDLQEAGGVFADVVSGTLSQLKEALDKLPATDNKPPPFFKEGVELIEVSFGWGDRVHFSVRVASEKGVKRMGATLEKPETSESSKVSPADAQRA